MKKMIQNIALVLMIGTISQKGGAQGIRKYSNSLYVEYGLVQYNSEGSEFLFQQQDFLSFGLGYNKDVFRFMDLGIKTRYYRKHLTGIPRSGVLGSNAIQAQFRFHIPRISPSWRLNRLSPYVGSGIGYAVEHLDRDWENYTQDYAFITLVGGVDYNFNDRWSLGIQGEYRLSGKKVNTIITDGSLNTFNAISGRISYYLGKRSKRPSVQQIYTRPQTPVRASGIATRNTRQGNNTIVATSAPQLTASSPAVLLKPDSAAALVDSGKISQYHNAVDHHTLTAYREQLAYKNEIQTQGDILSAPPAEMKPQEPLPENEVMSAETKSIPVSVQTTREPTPLPSGPGMAQGADTTIVLPQSAAPLPQTKVGPSYQAIEARMKQLEEDNGMLQSRIKQLELNASDTSAILGYADLRSNTDTSSVRLSRLTGTLPGKYTATLTTASPVMAKKSDGLMVLPVITPPQKVSRRTDTIDQYRSSDSILSRLSVIQAKLEALDAQADSIKRADTSVFRYANIPVDSGFANLSSQIKQLQQENDTLQRLLEKNHAAQEESKGNAPDRVRYTYFNTNQYKLDNNLQQQLSVLIDTIKSMQVRWILLEGFTDKSGNASYNLLLSKKRVQSVKAFLTERGIAKEIILEKTFGSKFSQELVNSNDRKVKITLIGE